MSSARRASDRSMRVAGEHRCRRSPDARARACVRPAAACRRSIETRPGLTRPETSASPSPPQYSTSIAPSSSGRHGEQHAGERGVDLPLDDDAHAGERRAARELIGQRRAPTSATPSTSRIARAQRRRRRRRRGSSRAGRQTTRRRRPRRSPSCGRSAVREGTHQRASRSAASAAAACVRTSAPMRRASPIARRARVERRAAARSAASRARRERRQRALVTTKPSGTGWPERDQPRQVPRLAAGLGAASSALRAQTIASGHGVHAGLGFTPRRNITTLNDQWIDRPDDQHAAPTSARASAPRGSARSSMPSPSRADRRRTATTAPAGPSRRVPGRDVELALDERVRQLAGHEPEPGPARRAARSRAASAATARRLRLAAAREPRERRRTPPPSPAPSRRSRAASCCRRRGAGRGTSRRRRAGARSARDPATRATRSARTPASTNAPSRNSAHARADRRSVALISVEPRLEPVLKQQDSPREPLRARASSCHQPISFGGA